MAFPSTSSSSVEINVTPLIDVLLVLLIVFMVLVPVVPRGIDSAVSQNHSFNAVVQTPTIIHVLAGPGGTLHYKVNDHETSLGDLRSLVERTLAARQDRSLFVQADRELSYGQIAAVLGEARQAGAGPVALLPQQRL